MLKLGIIRRKFNSFGGAEKFIERLVERLRARDIAVTIISEQWPESVNQDYRVIKIPASYGPRAFQQYKLQKQASEAIKKGGFDLTQSHERVLGARLYRLGDGLHKSWLARQSEERGYINNYLAKLDPYHRQIINLEKAILQSKDNILIANSALVRDECVRFYGRNPETIALIPNGVRTDFFRPPSRDEKLACREKLRLPNQVPVVAFVGSGFRRKGLFQLLNSMRICSDFSLVVAGKDKEFNNIQSFIHRYRLTDRVRLLGPTNDARNVYWASDIFVLPSLYDPSSNAILEALSCGLPCITTANVGSMTEILEVNAGARCERNPEDLAVKILKLISSETDINSLSINARRLAQRWDEKIVLEQWLTAYRNYRDNA